ncbi:helix-turn-helix domain-containing protein [Chitinophaga nivalis]|uniref:Helix-turn-helix domain-containing protein n=1 Tax=Chitinophaga nivalis TaxID=2991709 RepID=A0ABT3IUU0_9BACT|nr:helix-turn-helix domain-containing protein [Chitinophaga nivalis]MCW3462558.1 helix-turn-helix domain-containing protein [Chitinophaga nivalis]MCW3487751.1 helix-turn-helix domain-containing protein [Chitinophaga nivalis]
MQQKRIQSHKITDGVSVQLPKLSDVLIAKSNDRGRILPRQYPHRHEYYEITLVRENEGIHFVDFTPYPFKGSAVFLLSPEQVHELRREKGADGYSIKFNAAFFSSGNDPDSQLYAHFLFDNLQAYPVISLQPAEYNRLSTLLEVALEEYNHTTADNPDILFSYIRVILMEILRIRRQQLEETHLQPGWQQSQFREFKQLLETHFTTLHEVQDYAAKLFITPRQLNALSRKLTGKTAGVFIRDRLLLEARRLLFLHDLSIKEVGYRIGFEDPAYFTRFFKKNAGLSPQQFREQEQQV